MYEVFNVKKDDTTFWYKGHLKGVNKCFYRGLRWKDPKYNELSMDDGPIINSASSTGIPTKMVTGH
jgi:hypothetical protein